MNICLRREIEKLIEEGYVAAQRGELIDSDSVRRLMDERKTSWRSERQFSGEMMRK